MLITADSNSTFIIVSPGIIGSRRRSSVWGVRLNSVRAHRLRLLAVTSVLLTSRSDAKRSAAAGVRNSSQCRSSASKRRSPLRPHPCSHSNDAISTQRSRASRQNRRLDHTGASLTRCMSIKAMKYTSSPAPETVQATRGPRAALNWLRGSVERLRQHVLVIVAVSATAAAAIVGIAHYWTFSRFFVSTPDAYVQADSTIVASRVSGYVAAVMIADNQQVRTGEILARIDDRDFVAALDQTRAEVQAARAEIGDFQAQLATQDTLVAKAHASVAASRAALDLANLNRVRYQKMATIGFGSLQQSQEADAQARERTADLARDQAALGTAQREVQVLAAKLAQAQALLDRSQAVERRAALDLGYTAISAPIDGVVAARAVRVGQYVQAGTQLTALVPLQSVYVTANFKETQLTHVRAGQPVNLRVDTFPGNALRS